MRLWKLFGHSNALIVAAAAMSVVGVCPGAAHASPLPPPRPKAHVRPLLPGKAHRKLDARDGELMRQQLPLTKAARRIHQVVDHGGSGYAGLVLAVEDKKINVYWHGRPSAAITKLAARINRQNGDSVEIAIHPAAYSLDRLTAEGRRLLKSDGRIVMAAPEPDGSALRVRVENADGATSRPDLAAESSVRTVVEIGPAPTPSHRWNSEGAITAGAVIHDERTGLECSSGFGVSTDDDGSYTLAAAHCGLVGDVWKTPDQEGTSSYTGTTARNYPPYEAMLISSSPVGGTYAGGTDPSGAGNGETFDIVDGWIYPDVGTYVCQSGAYSGEICAIKVTRDNVSYHMEGEDGGDILVGDGVEAERTDHTSAEGEGDSGGPVYSYNTSADQHVYAVGINSAIDTGTLATCTGYNYSGRECAWRYYFANIQSIVDVAGIVHFQSGAV